MLMQLGDFQFEINTALYQELQRDTEYRWGVGQRIGQHPAQQFLGPGRDTTRLTGVVYTNFRGGYGQIDDLRTLAAQGKPLLMAGGDGYIFGYYTIHRVAETQTHIARHGQPLKQEFELELMFYGSRLNG